jgi:hypothetical protein
VTQTTRHSTEICPYSVPYIDLRGISMHSQTVTTANEDKHMIKISNTADLMIDDLPTASSDINCASDTDSNPAIETKLVNSRTVDSFSDSRVIDEAMSKFVNRVTADSDIRLESASMPGSSDIRLPVPRMAHISQYSVVDFINGDLPVATDCQCDVTSHLLGDEETVNNDVAAAGLGCCASDYSVHINNLTLPHQTAAALRSDYVTISNLLSSNHMQCANV